jgi:hypothetical protein
MSLLLVELPPKKIWKLIICNLVLRQHNVNMNTETRNSPRLDKARQKQSRRIPKYILDVLDKY